MVCFESIGLKELVEIRASLLIQQTSSTLVLCLSHRVAVGISLVVRLVCLEALYWPQRPPQDGVRSMIVPDGVSYLESYLLACLFHSHVDLILLFSPSHRYHCPP